MTNILMIEQLFKAKSQLKTNNRCLTEINLPLSLTLPNEDTNSRSLQCPL